MGGRKVGTLSKGNAQKGIGMEKAIYRVAVGRPVAGTTAGKIEAREYRYGDGFLGYSCLGFNTVVNTMGGDAA